ncbi:glycosyltransferase family A protein [uncultured Draconibacterium sp.]|uniref:glycosyltransferase family 2 protein n=1 Tax=uncultured Draconibacterium sp. TaxID=1573823 RepID=UPI0029C8E37B|nr:glycosyltransferase family A protein [uncultured Draconibacterium sp.]
MQTSPLISIIVPCYNQGKYLTECLNSVHSQRYENYEIVVINDGSTDAHTNKTVREISHPKVTVLQTENRGVSAARNRGIKNSTGRYILPLDADDKIGANFIQQAIEVLEKNEDIKVANCKVALFGTKNGILPVETYSLEKLLARNFIVVSAIFRRSDFEQTEGYNPNMREGFEDWDFWITLLKNGGAVHTLNDTGFFYRIKRNSRNASVISNREHYRKLRHQIYLNHQNIYSKHLLDPQESFEFELITQSREYKLGTILLKPIRTLYRLFH